MANRTTRQAGFTLIELLTIVAIIGILATIAIASSQWATRNASVDAATDDMVVQLAGLQGASLADGRERIFVLVDRGGDSGPSARAFVLTRPPASTNPAAWTLASFDPDRPWLNVAEYTQIELPRRARLLNQTQVAAPAPLQSANLYDSTMLTTCGTLACFALRFTPDGEVLGEAPAGGSAGRAGFGFIVGDAADPGTTPGAKRRGVVVGFPTGVVKSYVP